MIGGGETVVVASDILQTLESRKFPNTVRVLTRGGLKAVLDLNAYLERNDVYVFVEDHAGSLTSFLLSLEELMRTELPETAEVFAFQQAKKGSTILMIDTNPERMAYSGFLGDRNILWSPLHAHGQGKLSANPAKEDPRFSVEEFFSEAEFRRLCLRLQESGVLVEGRDWDFHSAPIETIVAGLGGFIFQTRPPKKNYLNVFYKNLTGQEDVRHFLEDLGIRLKNEPRTIIPCVFEILRPFPFASRSNEAAHGYAPRLPVKVVSNDFGTLLGTAKIQELLNNPQCLVQQILNNRTQVKTVLAKMGSLMSPLFTTRCREPAALQSTGEEDLPIFRLPEDNWFQIFDSYFFSHTYTNIFELRQLATCSCFFYHLITYRYGKLYLSKIPELPSSVGSAEAVLEEGLAIMEQAQSSSDDLLHSPTGKLRYAATNLDRVVCLTGGYQRPLVHAVEMKKAANRLFAVGKYAEAKQMYVDALADLESALPFACTPEHLDTDQNPLPSVRRVQPIATVNTDEDFLGPFVVEALIPPCGRVIPFSAGQLAYYELAAQLLSNAAQAALSLSSSHEIQESLRLCTLALQRCPHHTKSLWRMGKSKLLNGDLPDAKRWFTRAYQSTNNLADLRAIRKSFKELKIARMDSLETVASKYKQKLETNDSLSPDAIWKSAEVASDEVPELSSSKQTGTPTVVSLDSAVRKVAIQDEPNMEHYTVPNAFFQIARQNPNNVAMVYQESFSDGTPSASILYGELAQSVRAIGTSLTHLLRATLVDTGSSQQWRVGTMLSEGFPGITLIMAVWAIGGVVVPLDAGDPTHRILRIANDADLDLLVVPDDSMLEKIVSQEPRMKTLTYAHLQSDPIAPASGRADDLTQELAEVGKHDLSHIVFTSGSTGTPKGVLCEHRSLMAYARAKSINQRVGSTSRVLLASSFTFDPFLGDIATTLSHGGTLVGACRGDTLTRLAHCVRTLQVTHVCCTPPHWATLGDHVNANDYPHLECVALGGEKMSPAMIAQWSQYDATRKKPFAFMNTYGVTEATVYQTSLVCAPDSNPGVMGEPLSGITLFLKREDSEAGNDFIPPPASSEEASGEVGEICIGGVQVARGYLKCPELTEQRFIRASEGEGVLYRTGDLGRWTPNGMIELLGRADRQVKLRGRRVELGEIESIFETDALIAGALVKRAFVEVVSLRNGRTVLVAGMVSHNPGQERSVHFAPMPSWRGVAFRVHAERRLASYMIPQYFFVSDHSMPMTSNGKVDRAIVHKCLAAAVADCSESSSTDVADSEMMSDPIERALASIWTEFLGVGRTLRRTDNFFSLGGDSLAAVRASREFAKQYVEGGEKLIDDSIDQYGNFDNVLSPLVLLQHPVLHEYAALIRNAGIVIARSLSESAGSDMPNLPSTYKVCPVSTEEGILNRALRDASENGDLACVRVLLSLGANPDSGVTRKLPGVSALHAATSNSHVDVVRELLKGGAKVTVCTSNHVTPVHIAAQRSLEILRLLLCNGASSAAASDEYQAAFRLIGVTDGAKQTLLHHSARSGNAQSTAFLITVLARQQEAHTNESLQKKGKITNLDPRDRWNRTPLHWAILNNHFSVTLQLLDAGAKVVPYDEKKMVHLRNVHNSNTHLPMETPLELAMRVHGEESQFVHELLARYSQERLSRQ